MPARRGSAGVVRFAAPAAFLAAATVAVLLVRAGLDADDAPAPGPRTATVAKVSTARAEPRSRPTRRARPAKRRFYRIRAGDTLAVVAARFDTSVGRLERLNPGIDSTSLTIGQRVRVR